MQAIIQRSKIFHNSVFDFFCFREYSIDVRPDIIYNQFINYWQLKFKPELGRCFSYRAPDYIHAAIITTIEIYPKQSIDIYLHHPN